MSAIRTNHILIFDPAQLHYESSCWKRALAFMIEENIHLKNRLSEILQGHLDGKALEQAENFQNRFIKVDEFIRLLRDDLAALDKITGSTPNEIAGAEEISRRVKKIRDNMNRLESFMTSIKFQFNTQLSQKWKNEK